MVVDFAAEQSFESASTRLFLHHAICLSASCVRKITYRHAEQIKQLDKAQGCQGKLPAQSSKTVILEMDGSMIPIVDYSEQTSSEKSRKKDYFWKEFRLCAAQTQGQVQALYGVSASNVDDAGYCWAKTAARAGWALNTQLHTIADGAPWIYKQWEQNFSKKGRYLVDLYHVCDYLVAAQHIAGTHKRWLWVQKNRLKTNHPERVLNALADYLENPDVEDKDAPVRAAYRYIENRLDCLDYAGAIAEELPIGSGLIESGHRHVLQKRLKIAGAWWSIENAKSMAQLRVCRANKFEDQYWNSLAKAA